MESRKISKEHYKELRDKCHTLEDELADGNWAKITVPTNDHDFLRSALWHLVGKVKFKLAYQQEAPDRIMYVILRLANETDIWKGDKEYREWIFQNCEE